MGDIYAIITAICWSSAVILFDVSSKKMDSFQLNVLKNFVGVFGFILTIIVLSIPIPIFSQHEIIILFFSGVIGIAIADLLFLDSLRRIGSGLSAVVATIYSPSIFIIAYLLFGEIVKLQSYIGGVLVITGIVIATYKLPQIVKNNNLYIGIIFGVFAQIFTAYSVLLVVPIMENNPIIYIALIRFSIGLIVTAAVLVYRSGIYGLFYTLKEGLGNTTILIAAILGTYLSVIFWLAGFKYTLAGRAAIYNQLSTIFIIIMAVLFLKETMNVKKWIGITLSIIGAILVSMSQ